MSYATRSLTLVAAATIAFVPTAGSAEAEDPDLGGSTTRSASGAVRATAKSQVLAGYAGPGGDTGLRATFRVPDFSCRRDETSSLLTAVFANRTIGGGGRPTLVNGGGGVFLICQAGAPSVRSALYDPTGKPADAGSVAVGDKIRVTYESDPGAGTASSILENLTQDFITVTGPFAYIPTTDFQAGNLAITMDGSVGGPVPKVARSSLRPVGVDGRRIRRGRGGLTRYDLVDQDGSPIRTTSKINRAGFTVTSV